jgi:hypothetical protein
MFSCSRYKGGFYKGMKHGEGHERQDSVGGEYRGSWEGGQMHGAGVYRYGDGSEWARRYARGALISDELIGGPNQMGDGLSVEGAVEEGWRAQVKGGVDSYDPAHFETPRVDFTQAQDYAARMTKLRSRHRAVLLSVESQMAKELKEQGKGFSTRQRTKVMLVVAMRQATDRHTKAVADEEAAAKKEKGTLHWNEIRTNLSKFVPVAEAEQKPAIVPRKPMRAAKAAGGSLAVAHAHVDFSQP